MIAALIMGGVGIALMQLGKQQSKTTVRSKINSDLAQAKSEILNLLTSPANCNANFYGLSAGTSSFTEIYACNSSPTQFCLNTGATNKTVKFKVISDGSWPVPNPPTTVTISSKVKITSLSRTITAVNTYPPYAPNALTTARVDVEFTSMPMEDRTAATDKLIVEKMTFNSSVIYNGSTVIGCPRSWNSTTVYGTP